MTAAGLPGQEVLPQGRAPQSMAFFSTAGIERLCSGVTNSRASLASISPLKRATGAGTGCSLSWLYIGRSSICRNLASKASPPSFASACASLRLIDFAPVAADDDAELVLCHGSLYLWLRIVTKAR